MFAIGRPLVLIDPPASPYIDITLVSKRGFKKEFEFYFLMDEHNDLVDDQTLVASEDAEYEELEGGLISYQLKIPKERVAVLIGKEGRTKKKIEEETGASLDIDSEGAVDISGKDAVKIFTCREIVRAVGRGFNPKIALDLLKGDYVLEILSLRDVVGKSQKSMERLKGRIIGQKGKARHIIEEMTGANIAVYGKTIGIIGEVSAVGLAHRAISMLLGGSMHRTVYRFLEKKRQEARLGIGESVPLA